MRRRLALCGGLGAVVLAGLVLWLRPGGAPEVGRLPRGRKPPNILVILVDALRADRLDCYGDRHGLTPTMDALAAEGVTFELAVAQAPWTLPSVASLFTSSYPSVHRVARRPAGQAGRPPGKVRLAILPAVLPTLASRLHELGYQTAAFSANPFVAVDFDLDRGFDHFDASFAHNTTPGSVVNAAAVAWLKQRDPSKPWLIYLHYMDVHGPYEGDLVLLDRLLDKVEALPDKHVLTDVERRRLAYLRQLPAGVVDAERHERLMDYREYWAARYEAGVAAMDAQLAALRDELSELGLWNDAYVILTADHGEALCEHHHWDHGHSVFHEELHVPLVLRWPGVLPAGRRVSGPVGLIDLMPTLLDQLRGPPLAAAQGSSLLPCLSPAGPDAPRVAMAEMVKEGWEQKAMYRGTRVAILVEAQRQVAALYDIADDPCQQSIISSQAPAELNELIGLLEAQRAANVAAAPPSQGPNPTLTAAMRRRLETLGYVGISGRPSSQPGSAPSGRN